MPQHENDLYVEELRDENEELSLQVEELKLRLSQYENVDTSSTRSDENRSEWSEWPYCWFASGWERTANRFHSFYKIVHHARLTRQNIGAARCFQKRSNSDEAELTLMRI